MDNIYADQIMENLFQVFPVFHKKFLKFEMKDHISNVSRLQIMIMRVLDTGDKPVSQLADITMIPKPQMTHLINQMVEDKNVERIYDQIDRRRIFLKLTPQGHKLLDELNITIKKHIREKLEILSETDLKRMADALGVLREVLTCLVNK